MISLTDKSGENFESALRPARCAETSCRRVMIPIERQRQRRQAAQDDSTDGNNGTGDFGHQPRIQCLACAKMHAFPLPDSHLQSNSYTFKKRRGGAGGNLTI